MMMKKKKNHQVVRIVIVLLVQKDFRVIDLIDRSFVAFWLLIFACTVLTEVFLFFFLRRVGWNLSAASVNNLYSRCISSFLVQSES